jgi:BCCT family betaine/carnitine transporter
VVALTLALFSYNKGLPLTLWSAFYPIFGERVWRWRRHVINILAVFATAFGLATSLGIVTQQAAGINFLFGRGTGNSMLIPLIIVVTLIAIVSIVRGLEGGVKVLSEINMGLAALLLLFVILAGPTLAILTGFFDNLLAYGKHPPALSMPFGREDSNFAGG